MGEESIMPEYQEKINKTTEQIIGTIKDFDHDVRFQILKNVHGVLKESRDKFIADESRKLDERAQYLERIADLDY